MRYLILVAILVFTAGCELFAPPPTITREQFQAQHPSYSKQTVDDICNRIVRIGMTSEQVMYSWGRPSDVSRHIGTFGATEIWWWGTYQSVTLRNDVVTDVSSYR